MLIKKASLVGAFFVPGIWLSAVQAEVFCPAPASLVQVEVQRVVDGDTVRLKDGRSVRMIGLNAPETGKKGRPDEPFAVAARERLQALVQASDGRVGLVPGREAKDHYGRTLAHLYGANGRNLEAQLLADGLGFRWASRRISIWWPVSRRPKTARAKREWGCGGNRRCARWRKSSVPGSQSSAGKSGASSAIVAESGSSYRAHWYYALHPIRPDNSTRACSLVCKARPSRPVAGYRIAPGGVALKPIKRVGYCR